MQGPAIGGAFAVGAPAALAARVWRQAVTAMAPAGLVAKAVRSCPDGLAILDQVVPLTPFHRVLVLAAGKAAAGMARGLLPALTLPLGGLVVVPHGQGDPTLPLPQIEAGHPVPDEGSERAARAVEALVASATETDLVFVLLSGGASALLADPVPGVSLADLQQTTRALLASGAPITAINAVRKHLSRLKGGGLAAKLAPARVITLAISDVPDDRPDLIASGPTVPDPTTYAEAVASLKLAACNQVLPMTVQAHLAAGVQGRVAETPKGTEAFWRRQEWHIIGGRQSLLQAAVQAAEAAGCEVVLAPQALTGEAAEVGRDVARALRALPPVVRPTCWLAAGETTVTLPPQHGQGGRNQELALAAAVALAGTAGMGVLAAGTDGIDGPTDVAGAWADGRTVARGLALGHDAVATLAAHDAYGYFAACGGHWRPGPTGTNISDLVVGLAWPEGRDGGR